jgi:hypothetical protein
MVVTTIITLVDFEQRYADMATSLAERIRAHFGPECSTVLLPGGIITTPVGPRVLHDTYVVLDPGDDAVAAVTPRTTSAGGRVLSFVEIEVPDRTLLPLVAEALRHQPAPVKRHRRSRAKVPA